MNFLSSRLLREKPLFGIGLLASVILATWLVTACASRAPAPPAPLFTSFLVETDWLAQHPTVKELVLVDVRPEADYQQGHISGAANLSLAQITDAKNPVRGMVAQKEQIEGVIKGLGVNQDSLVVIYDEGNTPNPARLFWALHYYGLSRVSILNGGYTKWRKQGYPIETKAPSRPSGSFIATPNPPMIADKAYVRQSLGKAGVVILDVRSPGEYQGRVIGASRGGHIPGAINLEWVNNLRVGEVAEMKPALELKQIYEGLGVTPDKEVIVYCQTGTRAAQTYFTLRYLGYGQVRLYDGSWEEWGNDASLPVEGGSR